MKFYILLLVGIISLKGIGQQQMTIIDKNTKRGIPFVQAIANDSIYHLADENGLFQFKQPEKISSLRIFNDQYADVLNLYPPFERNYFLTEPIIELKEVTLLSNSFSPQKKIFRPEQLDQKIYTYALVSTRLFITEIISADLLGKTITDVELFHKKKNLNGVMKINFYNENKGLPYQLIHSQYVFYKKGEIRLNKKINVNNRIFIGFSWLGQPNKMGNHTINAYFKGIKIKAPIFTNQLDHDTGPFYENSQHIQNFFPLFQLSYY